MVLTGVIEENLVIDKNTLLLGICKGEVGVINHATLTINGILNGIIQIAPSSKLIVNGIVNGNILNAGICDISGTVNGQLHYNGGVFNITKDAIVLSTIY